MKKMLFRVGKFIYFFSAFFVLFSGYAFAYIDPSAVTYMIQAVAAVVIAIGAALTVFRHKIVALFKSGKGNAAKKKINFTDDDDDDDFEFDFDSDDKKEKKAEKSSEAVKAQPSQAIVSAASPVMTAQSDAALLKVIDILKEEIDRKNNEIDKLQEKLDKAYSDIAELAKKN